VKWRWTMAQNNLYAHVLNKKEWACLVITFTWVTQKDRRPRSPAMATKWFPSNASTQGKMSDVR
jgi:hypothetical protein